MKTPRPRSILTRNGFAVRPQDQQDGETYPAWFIRTYRFYRWTMLWVVFCLTAITLILAIDLYRGLT